MTTPTFFTVDLHFVSLRLYESKLELQKLFLISLIALLRSFLASHREGHRNLSSIVKLLFSRYGRL